jgi:5-methylcytosine-specific restriction endonuclease McrA
MTSMFPKPWTRLYGTRRWERRSKWNLKNNPLCAECKRRGLVQEATLSHHLVEYVEGMSEVHFFLGDLESLCLKCHLAKHGRTMRTYKTAIGIDGYPIDEQNPFWIESKKQEKRNG